MKITITPGGDVTFNADTPADAIEIVTALLERTNKAPSIGRPPAKGLSPALQEIYDYLLDNDSEEGVSRTNLADAFGIKVSAMDQRLRQLKKRDYAKQISRAQWRAA